MTPRRKDQDRFGATLDLFSPEPPRSAQRVTRRIEEDIVIPAELLVESDAEMLASSAASASKRSRTR